VPQEDVPLRGRPASVYPQTPTGQASAIPHAAMQAAGTGGAATGEARPGWNSRLSALARQDRRLAMTDTTMTDVMPGQAGTGSAASVQASVGRLAGLSMRNQGGFNHLALGTGAAQYQQGQFSGDVGSIPSHLHAGAQHKAVFPSSQEAENTEPAAFLPELSWLPGASAQQLGAPPLPMRNMRAIDPSVPQFTPQPAPFGTASQTTSHVASYDLARITPHVVPGQMAVGNTQLGRGGMVPASGVDHSVLLAGGVSAAIGAGGHPSLAAGNPVHPTVAGAHQDALMELARENLLLKHQLQVATVEMSRLRQSCEKYANLAEDGGLGADGSRLNQSRYWTDDEHERFLDAIRKFGQKDVKAIAAYVGSRNATQVRTHAQKYFMRLARSSKVGRGGLYYSAAGGSKDSTESNNDAGSGPASEAEDMGGGGLHPQTAAAALAASGEAGTSAAAAAAFRAAGSSSETQVCGGGRRHSGHAKLGSDAHMSSPDSCTPAGGQRHERGHREGHDRGAADRGRRSEGSLAEHDGRDARGARKRLSRDPSSAECLNAGHDKSPPAGPSGALEGGARSKQPASLSFGSGPESLDFPHFG
jgi:SHAQKYF class myb-like DNA-binding protein